MRTWQYQVVDIHKLFNTEEAERKLDKLGEAGWELVSAFPIPESEVIRHYFKIPVDKDDE